MDPKQQPEDPATMDALINDLASKNGIVRQKARHALVRMGRPALDLLTVTFETKANAYAHWEAAKAISEIGGPEAVTPLLEALGDDDFSIRWLAAEGLIAVGGAALEAIAKALAAGDPPGFLSEGAHHVIHDLVSKKIIDAATIEQIAPLQEALTKVASIEKVELEAARFLGWLRANHP